MMAQVERAIMVDRQVDVHLIVTGLGGPLMLQDIEAPGAAVQFEAPVAITFAQDVRVTAAVTFATPPPDVFTLVLNFGIAGLSAVTVMPEPAKN
ncbi:hypothetical protein [uncultured Tateyamaria sp.]|uniref:hypothetical protein n=1 Tax=uncultured Tateyamaria sp. TaxID=455651 RepID=UPI002607ABD1|nr:hypothetical protein [uncultured Tateyamaria sp.]